MMTQQTLFNPRKTLAQRGFTLIEVLIAVLVLSIGLLGLAGLQARGLQQNYGALQRTQASVLASDILERIRINRNRAILGDYVTGYTDAAPTSPTTVAQTDIANWKNAVTNKLGGKGKVEQTGDRFTVSIQWDDARAAGENSETLIEFVFVTEL